MSTIITSHLLCKHLIVYLHKVTLLTTGLTSHSTRLVRLGSKEVQILLVAETAGVSCE